MLRLSLPKATPSAESTTRRPTRLNLGPLFTLSADALVVQDVATARIAHWNPAAERLFGYSAVEAVGKPIAMLLPPAVARLHHERLAHFARTGEVDVLTDRDSLQIPAIEKRGDEVRVELSTAPIDPEGRYVLLTFRDGTSTKRAELQALELARAESALADAEARLASRERLLLEAPRDVERALRRVRRASARLNSPEALADPDRAALLARLVAARIAEAERVARDVADAAAFEAGTFDLNLERLNLVPLISQIVADARRRAPGHRINLGVPQGLTLLVDPVRLEAVVERLIDHAVRRNPRGAWIDVDVRRPLAGLARIEVRDYGRSLSSREREALPRGARPSRAWLVIQSIVQRHGGTLSVAVEPEGGCRVAVTLSTNGGRVTA